MIKKCLMCSKEFITYPFFIKRGGGKYCSRECYSQSRIGSKHSKETCKKMRETFNPNRFQKGTEHYNWKGGIINQSGYVMIYSPEHPHCNKRNYVYEHRLVVERKLNRYLCPKEIVHHLNEKRNDNRLENLFLFPNKWSHTTYHALLRNQLIKPIDRSNLLS